MAVRTPGADEIREIAADFGMTLSAADANGTAVLESYVPDFDEGTSSITLRTRYVSASIHTVSLRTLTCLPLPR